MSQDPIPAIPEAEAEGETAAIFADIRATYRVGVVNLVWRHLATIPGGLAHVWALARPGLVDGSVAREAAWLRGEMELPALPPVPEEALSSLGLGGLELAGIRRVLGAYDRTNAMALLGLTAVRQRIAGGGLDVALAGPEMPPWEELALPALPAIPDLPPEVARLVRRLNRLGADRPDPLLASMYRHLAPWPPMLALAWALLAPLHEQGQLGAAIAGTMAAADRRAARIATPALPTPPALLPVLDAAIARFTEDPIVRMTVLCAMLAGALGVTPPP